MNSPVPGFFQDEHGQIFRDNVNTGLALGGGHIQIWNANHQSDIVQFFRRYLDKKEAFKWSFHGSVDHRFVRELNQFLKTRDGWTIDIPSDQEDEHVATPM